MTTHRIAFLRFWFPVFQKDPFQELAVRCAIRQCLLFYLDKLYQPAKPMMHGMGDKVDKETLKVVWLNDHSKRFELHTS